MGTVTIGVDIGQKRDPTAVAVVEFDRRPQTKQVAQPAGDVVGRIGDDQRA